MRIEIKGSEGVVANFSRFEVATALKAGIRKGIFALETRAKPETPVGVSGMLRNGYRSTFSGLRGELVNTKLYAPFVHDGRKPGKFPPLAPIALWVKRKGIGVPAFVIARSIARKGTKANPFMTRTVEAEETNVRAIIQGEIRSLASKSFK